MIVRSHVPFPFNILIKHSRFGIGEDKLVMHFGRENIIGPPMFLTPDGKQFFDLPGVYHFTEVGEDLKKRTVFIPRDQPRKVGWFDEFGWWIELRFWHFRLAPP